MKSILKNSISGIIFILLVIVLFLTLTSSYPVLFGLSIFNVLTGSMVPTIPIGGLVVTRPMPSYQIGDIISFTRGTLTVTHRIISIKGNQFIVKGDANKIADPELVNKSNIIGKDILIVPFLGKFVTFLKTPIGFIIFILIPALVIIFLEAKEFKREWEKEVEKKLLKKIEANHET